MQVVGDAKEAALDRNLNILTHHKCASAWLQRYMLDFSKLNSKSFLYTHYSNIFPNDHFDIVEFANASYDFMSGKIDSGIHIIRNPMDIIVSAYFSHKRTHPTEEWPQLSKQRRILESVSAGEGMFITLAFLERDDGPLHAIRHWDYDDKRFMTVKMEDVVENPQGVLGPILQTLFSGCVLPPEANHTFSAISGRKIGEVDDASHYRSGKRDQWRDALPPTIVSYMRAHYEGILERYYPDSAYDN